MPRDYRSLLADVPCWDQEVDHLWYVQGKLKDCVVQQREELIAFCEWIESQQIRSYLEIGVWTGRLVSVLQALFQFKPVAACDLGLAGELGQRVYLPREIYFLPANSHSLEYQAWREQFGMIDLVLIDGDHSYDSVKRDFEINRRYPHRFLVFHDIANQDPTSVGVSRFWKELEGNKLEIHRPDLNLRSRMGIGIWWE
jgi:hypothetical protein